MLENWWLVVLISLSTIGIATAILHSFGTNVWKASRMNVWNAFRTVWIGVMVALGRSFFATFRGTSSAPVLRTHMWGDTNILI